MLTQRILVCLTVSALALSACEKKSQPAEAQSATAPAVVAPTVVGAGATDLSGDAQQRLQRVLAAYETVRAALARDEIEPAVSAAGDLQKAANDAKSSVPSKLAAPLGRVADSAGQLQKAPKSDAASVRRTFGQVSEALVALLSAEPSLQNGQHIFECPMAEGYKKWVQPGEKVANPYMGKQMLECGSASKW